MPLSRMEKYERYPPISLRAWKDKEQKKITFLDEGRDVNTVNGLQVVFAVNEGSSKETKSLWIKPSGSLHIGLNEFIPLKDKTLAVTKTIDKGDVLKGTRYTAKEIVMKL